MTRPARALLVAQLLLMAGCASPPPEPPADPPRFTFIPITRNALVEVVSPSPPYDRAPACQILRLSEFVAIRNLTATAVWSATAERTRNLTLRLDPPGGPADVANTGRSPLNANAATFNASHNDQVRVLLGLVGSEPTDVLLRGQQAALAISFVVQRDGNNSSPLNARWDSQAKCPV